MAIDFSGCRITSSMICNRTQRKSMAKLNLLSPRSPEFHASTLTIGLSFLAWMLWYVGQTDSSERRSMLFGVKKTHWSSSLRYSEESKSYFIKRKLFCQWYLNKNFYNIANLEYLWYLRKNTLTLTLHQPASEGQERRQRVNTSQACWTHHCPPCKQEHPSKRMILQVKP